MAQELSTPRTTEIAPETLEFFGGDELRIRCFLDKYALRDLTGKIIEKTPIQMWERVAREIASVETDAKKRPEWEKKFYWLLEDFRFIPGGRIMFGAGQPRRATLLNCFPAGTQIWTRHGPKPIEQIEVGEEVLTHRNRFRPVIHTMSREIEEPLRSIRLWYLGYTTIYATKEHRFLTFDGKHVRWITAGELTPRHYVRVGRIEETHAPEELDLTDYVEDAVAEDESLYTATAFVGGNGARGVKESKRVRRKIPVDERLGLWLGFFVAEGGTTDSSVYFTFSKDEHSYAETLCALTRQLFGLEAAIQERTDQPGHWLRVYVHSKLLVQFVRAFFPGGLKAHERELPSWFLTAPRRFQKAFLAGLLKGDGVIRENSIKIFLANPYLMHQIFFILLRLGIVASLRWEGMLKYTRHRGMWIHIGTQRYVQALKAWLAGDWEHESSFTEAPQNYFYKVLDGELFVKVKECGWTVPHRLKVYDLSVAEDHSFVAEFVVAHNCYVIPIKEDSIEGIFEWCKEAARTYSLGGGVGCVAKGSYVITRDGVKRIEDVQEGEEVLSYNPVLQQKEFRRVLQVHRPIVRRADNVAIYLKDGTRLITSRWHPTLVFREDRFQYVPAGEVRPTDAMLATPELHTLPLNSQRLHDPQMAWWTGAHLGDGTAYQRPPRPLTRDYQGRGRERRSTRVKFYNRCKEVAQEYARIFNERTGSALTVHLRQRPTGPLYEVATSSYEAGDLIDLYVEGLYGKKATRAEIPRWIWNASRESQLAFLAGLIDTDGHVAAARFRVEFNTSSKELAYGLKTLLALLGARAWISAKPRDYQGQHSVVRRCQCAYRVATSDTSILSEIARYMVNPEKKRRLLEGTPPPNNRDPVAVPAFAREFLKRHATYKRVGHLRYSALKGLEKGWINRKTFLKLMEAIIAQAQDPQVYYQALSLRSLCLSLTPVEKVVAGVEADEEFCDLTVEGNNNYFAGEGGLSVIHNTDISILRPKGSPVNNSAIYSSGSVSFMELFSTTTGTIGQSGRRGALMITIRVDHPDVLDFIEIKNDPERRKVQYANISVRVTDEFMRAVQRDEEFLLHYENERIGRFEKRVRAREIWEKLVKNAWASAEPGVIFWDTVKRESTTEYNGMEVITTNPCSEIPLEAYGACCLGNVNLSKFVLDSFTPNARIDWPNLEKALRYAVRFLDDVLDYNADKHPLPAQREASLRSRRIGVGFTGFGDMLIKLGLKYDSEEAIAFTDKLFERIKHIVYDESTELAVEKGTFPAFDCEKHLKSAFIKRLDKSLIEKIKRNGLRNAALLTVPPVGSGSVLAGCSSGIEPIFSLSYVRKSKSLSKSEFEVSHPLVREYMEKMGLSNINELPKTFVTAHEIEPIMRVRMQATIQKHIDHAISSTVNLAKDVSPETIGDIYFEAWKAGCKGITVYREGSREGILLTKEAPKESEKPARATLVPRPRPRVAKGKTYRMKTELGTVFITVNEDEEGIFEVFVQGLGKSGTSTAAFTEAIGRLISLALRSGVKPSAIIDQLSLIRGSRPVVQEDGTVVFSVPDAIAKAIAEYLRGGEQLTLLQEVKPRPPQPSESNGHDAKRDVELCPSCGGVLMFTNGCYICSDCGFSECD